MHNVSPYLSLDLNYCVPTVSKGNGGILDGDAAISFALDAQLLTEVIRNGFQGIKVA